jgi:hypothetical protein
VAASSSPIFLLYPFYPFEPLQGFIHGVENVNVGVPLALTVDFHHAPQPENVRLGRNESATRLGGEDATPREGSGLVCRYLELRYSGHVDQLIEARVKVEISEQSSLVTYDVIERHATIGGREDQPSLFVDGVPYVHFSSHPSARKGIATMA